MANLEEMWLQFRIKYLNLSEKEAKKHPRCEFGIFSNVERCREKSEKEGKTYIDCRRIFFNGKKFIGSYTFGKELKEKEFSNPEEAYGYIKNLPFNPLSLNDF